MKPTQPKCEVLKRSSQGAAFTLAHDRNCLFQQRKLINEFFFDLTIAWEFLGFDQWNELLHWPVQYGVIMDEVWMPKFRYLLRWGDKSMTFVMMYVPVQHRLGEGIRELEAVEVLGDKPPWNWREYLDIDSLYAETEEQFDSGNDHGEIVPTWINLFDVITANSGNGLEWQ